MNSRASTKSPGGILAKKTGKSAQASYLVEEKLVATNEAFKTYRFVLEELQNDDGGEQAKKARAVICADLPGPKLYKNMKKSGQVQEACAQVAMCVASVTDYYFSCLEKQAKEAEAKGAEAKEDKPKDGSPPEAAPPSRASVQAGIFNVAVHHADMTSIHDKTREWIVGALRARAHLERSRDAAANGGVLPVPVPSGTVLAANQMAEAWLLSLVGEAVMSVCGHPAMTMQRDSEMQTSWICRSLVDLYGLTEQHPYAEMEEAGRVRACLDGLAAHLLEPPTEGERESKVQFGENTVVNPDDSDDETSSVGAQADDDEFNDDESK